MAGRWGDPSAFRADPAATPTARPSYRQTIALLAVLLLVAGAVAVASYVVRPDRARAFQLFHGSLFLADEQSPVAIDLPSGRPTLRLVGADKQVGVTGSDGLGVVPLDGGTLLLNQRTGEFNMVDNSGFVVKHDGGGVPLGHESTDTTAIGVADGELAYVIRNSGTGADIFLVSQATVTAALSATGAVTPRASTTLPGGSVDSNTPGTAVAADGALWALVSTGGDFRSIREFTYPADSNPGVRLTGRAHGSVPAIAAIATATTGQATVVGVASTDRIRIFGATERSIPFIAPAGVTAILPATDADTRLSYLLQGSGGWSVMSIGADGSDLRAPKLVTGLPATDRLAQPAYSRGALYTLDRDTGAVYRIALDGTATKVAQYPIVPRVETTNLDDGYVIARESRVVVNSGKHSEALVLFTDGSHLPRVVEKSSAVQVSAAGGAEQLARTTVNAAQQPGQNQSNNGSKPRTTPAEVVNPHLDCKNVTQTPHVPAIGALQAGSRSVTLNWTYPILDKTQDCYPSTYEVEIKRLSQDAPKAPGSATIQGQQGATITGLYPDSRYEVRVTAFINGQGTSSTWVPFATGPEGPAAPTGLTVAADAAGNWILDWASCGGVQQGCVPAQSWTVTPSFCDGRGLSAPPAAATAPADPTSRQQPTYKYTGGDALLGRGLQFVVTGSGTTQVAGTPSAKTKCVYSWTAPDAGAMTLTASKPDNSSLGGTTSTTVRLDLTGNPTHAVGGVGAKIQFVLNGPDGTHSQTVTYPGTGSSVTANFTGLRAGANYTATAVVSPPGHPSAAVHVGPQTVTPAADWPDVGLDARCDPQGDVIQLTCKFTANISGISSAAVNGESFDIVDTNDTSSGVRCGNGPLRPLDASGIDPATPITFSLNLFQYNGTCTVTIVLKENGPIFGGTLKKLSTQYTVGGATTYDPSASDWDQAWVSKGGASQAEITYKGSKYSTSQLSQITQNWTVTVLDPDGNPCGSWNGSNPPDGVDVSASGSCVQQSGDRNGWSVTIGYQDATDGTAHTVPGSHVLPGQPPTYQPCTATSFTASWTGTAQTPTIELKVGPQLAGCSGWIYEIHDSGDQICPATSSGTPDDMTFTPTCATPPSAGDWKILVRWNDAAGKAQGPQNVPVDGDPPQ